MNKNPQLTTAVQLKNTITMMVEDIVTVIDACSPEQYIWTTEKNKSSIGDHIRHTIEFIIALNNGQGTGIIDYDCRARDIKIATQQEYAKTILRSEAKKLQEIINNETMQKATIATQDGLTIVSTFGKEAAGIPSHTTHHLAVIKPILDQQGITIDRKIGIAPATLEHERKEHEKKLTA